MSSGKKYAIVFQCPVPKCMYSSKRLYNLQRHEKTHSKEHWRSKRFPCPCCAYAAATRPHLKRHMGNKHPEEDISKHDLSGLSYEHFAKPLEEEEAEVEAEEDEVEELIKMDEFIEEEVPVKATMSNTSESKQQQQIIIEGPVTVLQMVTPLSPQTKPGEMYCNVTLEGEDFRLIPVAFVSRDGVRKKI